MLEGRGESRGGESEEGGRSEGERAESNLAVGGAVVVRVLVAATSQYVLVSADQQVNER